MMLSFYTILFNSEINIGVFVIAWAFSLPSLFQAIFSFSKTNITES